MRFLYTWVFRLAMPIILLRLLWRSWYLPAYRKRWRERLAWLESPLKKEGIWIHAVSFGEAMLAIPIIQAIQKQYPEVSITVTNMTPTGSEKIRTVFGNQVSNFYVPYDLPGIMRRFIKKIQPRLVIIIETELWPNMLNELKKQDIPVILANGRLSAKSAANYKKIPRLIKDMLNCFTQIFIQTEAEAKRYQELGCDPNKIVITGSIKFDIIIPENLELSARQLRQQLGIDRSIFIAASTHEGEEVQILKAFMAAKKDIPDLLLLLVPRHPERFEKVAVLCQEHTLTVVRRSSGHHCIKDTDVFLGDTMGELLLFYAVSDAVFVGGSLVEVGGHNLLEPAALAKAIITGPYMHNFLRITELLLAAKGICQITDSEGLTKSIIELIQIPSLQKELGLNAKKVVLENRGALKKHMDAIFKIYTTAQL